MRSVPPPQSPWRSVRWPITGPLLTSVVSAILLTACAQIPDLGPRAALPEAGSLAATQSMPGRDTAAWPADPWWMRYGDPQLNALMDEALRDAPSLKVAEARLRQAAAVVEQQGASLRPSTSVNAGVNRERQSYNNGIPAAFVPQGWNNYGQAAVQLSYEVDLWGRQHDLLTAATSSWMASQADAAQARLSLAAQLATAYADFARLCALEDTAKAAQEARQQTARLMREREAHGLETRAATRQAQARLAQAEGDLLSIQESLVLQRHLIAALLGAGPDRGVSLSRPVVDLSQVQGLPAQIELNLLGRRPDIVAARLRAESAGKKIDAARTAFYPNVNLSASFGFQSLGLDMLARSSSQTGSFGPAISLPLFDQGRLTGQYKQAYGVYDEAVAQYRQTLAQALQDVADVAASETALGDRLAQAQLACDASQDAWTLTRRRYEGGLSTYLDVLSAEDSYLSQARALTELQARLMSLDVSLIKALGGGYQTPASRPLLVD
ncbi:efflux transporter, outer membrane factor (OMF) lipoprotein, NodT family [Roseateles sp. YR242]|uniref:efflux transporter outer membrane subunit n=1 Tax=Roseateles sp. YR242 TaxID=1855305 RepID=UPI0008C56890|nr:efflux transporter outer membrane subunit [Roseateles sp. YR242]SEL65489.1 efflux transporter, outer membrane factor (OMF) lipoprotein, NodT family [Roseateles sp. YR242]